MTPIEMSVPTTTSRRGMTRARRRDRRIYFVSHPLLYGLVTMTAGFRRLSIGRTLVVNDPNMTWDIMTKADLNRTGKRTTGQILQEHYGSGGLFDESGQDHRRHRSQFKQNLSHAALPAVLADGNRLLAESMTSLAEGDSVDIVTLTRQMAGVTARRLIDIDVDPLLLAQAAEAAAAEAARAHLRRARTHGTSYDDLLTLVGGDLEAAVLAVTAVNTTIATIPRAVAWCSDADLWSDASKRPTPVAAELLRVIAPSPVLPRVMAGPLRTPAINVRSGQRVLLMTRNAARTAGSGGPYPRFSEESASVRAQQLVFGVGPHACPGQALAVAQLAGVLETLAPLRPRVISARVDRQSALPAWRSLVVQAAPNHPSSIPVSIA